MLRTTLAVALPFELLLAPFEATGEDELASPSILRHRFRIASHPDR